MALIGDSQIFVLDDFYSRQSNMALTVGSQISVLDAPYSWQLTILVRQLASNVIPS